MSEPTLGRQPLRHFTQKRQAVRTPKQVILQATPFCNIDCRYCYLPDRANTKLMSSAVAERIFGEIFRGSLFEDPILFVWHAGEPLTAGKRFFTEMFDLADTINLTHHRKLSHNIQTNGMLIDDEWAAMFRARRVSIGLSIDGPAHIHDRHRVTRSGRGTHAEALRGGRLLQQHGVPFNVISVLTTYSLDFPDEMFAFYRELGVPSVGFNIDELEGVHDTSSFVADGAIAKYKAFMRRFLELCDASRGALTVREFTSLIPVLLDPTETVREPKCSTNTPLYVITFDHLGNYSTFCPELMGQKAPQYNNFVMGNVLTDSLDTITDSPVFQSMNHDIQEGVRACKEQCGYWSVCGGGFPSNKFFEHGRFDVTETLACRVSKQATVDVVLEYLERKLEQPK